MYVDHQWMWTEIPLKTKTIRAFEFLPLRVGPLVEVPATISPFREWMQLLFTSCCPKCHREEVPRVRDKWPMDTGPTMSMDTCTQESGGIVHFLHLSYPILSFSPLSIRATSVKRTSGAIRPEVDTTLFREIKANGRVTVTPSSPLLPEPQECTTREARCTREAVGHRSPDFQRHR